MSQIHPTAVIDASAHVAHDATIGPYSIIGAGAVIGAGCVIGPHVVVGARTRMGERNRIFQFASIGEIAQDRKYGGEPTTTTIGNDNTFREYATVHGGTAQDRGDTMIGNGNLFLAYTHVAHDCVVGDFTTFSNNAQIAGHVHIGDWAVLGAFAGAHQFCRIGAHAMVAAFAVVLQDVPPYVTVQGYPAKPHGTNAEGLKRRGFGTDDLLEIRRAYKTIYRANLPLDEARAQISARAETAPVLRPLAQFLAVDGRGIVR
jgi:UDP-N-acetylglucosamine acyltransferase